MRADLTVTVEANQQYILHKMITTQDIVTVLIGDYFHSEVFRSKRALDILHT